MAAAEVAYYTDEEMMLIDDDCIKKAPEDKLEREKQIHPLLHSGVRRKIWIFLDVSWFR